jgi:hypothetical protein
VGVSGRRDKDEMEWEGKRREGKRVRIRREGTEGIEEKAGTSALSSSNFCNFSEMPNLAKLRATWS